MVKWWPKRQFRRTIEPTRTSRSQGWPFMSCTQVGEIFCKRPLVRLTRLPCLQQVTYMGIPFRWVDISTQQLVSHQKALGKVKRATKGRHQDEMTTLSPLKVLLVSKCGCFPCFRIVIVGNSKLISASRDTDTMFNYSLNSLKRSYLRPMLLPTRRGRS